MSVAATGRPFTGASLDRASVERKDPAWVAELGRSAKARAIAAGRDGVLVRGGEPGGGDGWGETAVARGGVEVSQLARLRPTEEQLAEPILLGVVDGAGLFAIDLDREASRERPADDGSWGHDGAERDAHVISLREAGVILAHEEAGLAAYLTALLNWHRRHRFCANCGAETDITEAGFVRHCPRCGAHHFPRTDPVVIMTVEHDGRLLLGRRTGWPQGRLSVLAGFISPGEAAEEAVVREVQEESGIVCRDPVYVTSQPWPFPASLMLGFHALCDGGEPSATDGELDEVHWLAAEQVRGAIEGRNAEFVLPGEVSIARFLIDRWVADRAD